ncbi:probable palmitoyltransferase ZDHHC24 isoform X3 [Glossina fuscipes]|uniref:Palmitoyltransferase n=1 Tax=Glossina fuscipes TaxID=7396 RepID=A0A9C5ZKR2_9MUSC|nr:probable palmitoyltransferase ZDHHC24 isoform X3 [Glossina fuscipes]
MRIRKNVWPRRHVDWLCFLLIGISMPFVFIFEMIVVLPFIHPPGSFLHTFTFAMAVFLIFNITGNFAACIMVDTSVDGLLKVPEKPFSAGWHKCVKCLKIVPPRSWHCKICNCCILKRDHHCPFTGCCVGYRNHRYFIMFILFLFIGSTYAFIYNSVFLWTLKSVYSIVLLIYHLPVILKGGVSYERRKGAYPYGNDRWQANLQEVFGKRMHLAWLSPLLRSELIDSTDIWKID